MVSREGFIKKVWAGESFDGPVGLNDLPGLHLRDIMTPQDAEKALDYIDKAIVQDDVIRETITLSLPVHHKKRIVRIFPQGKTDVLAYLVKNAV